MKIKIFKEGKTRKEGTVQIKLEQEGNTVAVRCYDANGEPEDYGWMLEISKAGITLNSDFEVAGIRTSESTNKVQVVK